MLLYKDFSNNKIGNVEWNFAWFIKCWFPLRLCSTGSWSSWLRQIFLSTENFWVLCEKKFEPEILSSLGIVQFRGGKKIRWWFEIPVILVKCVEGWVKLR